MACICSDEKDRPQQPSGKGKPEPPSIRQNPSSPISGKYGVEEKRDQHPGNQHERETAQDFILFIFRQFKRIEVNQQPHADRKQANPCADAVPWRMRSKEIRIFDDRHGLLNNCTADLRFELLRVADT